MQLWGMPGTRKAFLAFLGNLLRSSSKILVVVIGVLLRVPKVTFGVYFADCLHFVLLPIQEQEAAESRKVVVLFLLGGLAQPGGFSSQILIELFVTLSPPAALPHHPGFPLVVRPGEHSSHPAGPC